MLFVVVGGADGILNGLIQSPKQLYTIVCILYAVRLYYNYIVVYVYSICVAFVKIKNT